MRRGFTIKLALTNIKKNRKFYLPYILASVGIISIFYIMLYLATNSGLKNLPQSGFVGIFLVLGSIIVGIFSLIFLFYINSFLMKRRNKEIGMYNILGMEKRHIARLLLVESLMTTAISVAGGLLLGILFSKVFFLAYCHLLQTNVPVSDLISVGAVFITAVVFTIFFTLILIKNQMALALSRPIDLLKGGNVGEREPKTRVIPSLLGVICLAAGYGISIRIDNPLEAVFLFFIAVILVIFGTYLLFTMVSIAVLKALRKNRNYYYKAGHFTTVSGLLFRMKQNAVGMANICILSTMVIIMISTTVCLQAGIKDIIKTIAPGDININGSISRQGQLDTMTSSYIEENNAKIKKIAERNGISIKDVRGYTAAQLTTTYSDGIFAPAPLSKQGHMVDMVMVIPVDIYNNFTGKNITLNEGQVVTLGSNAAPDNIRIGQREFKRIDHVDEELPNNFGGMNQYYLVVDNLDTLEKIVEEFNGANGFQGIHYGGLVDVNASSREINNFAKDLSQDSGLLPATISTKQEVQNLFHSLSSGFLFMGVLLGTVFTFAAALIIYYKQISEGYYDKEKYEIMQKVGMSKKAVKASIRTQVLMVFFAPLLVAGCHMAGAFNMMRLLLNLFKLTNINLFITCCALTFILFATIYLLVYLFTAREYYKIVRWTREEPL
ncbi:MAG: ABC transporter permease [Anaerovoracaceae bacterium]